MWISQRKVHACEWLNCLISLMFRGYVEMEYEFVVLSVCVVDVEVVPLCVREVRIKMPG